LIGGDLPVRRLAFGAMRLTGAGVWGEPRDHDEATQVLRRAVELGVNFIDTADSYGPEVSERVIAEALYPELGQAFRICKSVNRSVNNMKMTRSNRRKNYVEDARSAGQPTERCV
jgi:aryl-alcohol dehydrogenase-like predicted oxidoreductase